MQFIHILIFSIVLYSFLNFCASYWNNFSSSWSTLLKANCWWSDDEFYHSVRVSGNVFFPFSGYLHRVCNYKLHLFSFSIFNVSFHCEKLAISLIAILLKVTFLPWCFKNFLFSAPPHIPHTMVPVWYA